MSRNFDDYPGFQLKTTLPNNLGGSVFIEMTPNAVTQNFILHFLKIFPYAFWYYVFSLKYHPYEGLYLVRPSFSEDYITPIYSLMVRQYVLSE